MGFLLPPPFFGAGPGPAEEASLAWALPAKQRLACLAAKGPLALPSDDKGFITSLGVVVVVVVAKLGRARGLSRVSLSLALALDSLRQEAFLS